MLEAIPAGIFSNRFRLEQENQLLGEFDPSIWRDKAQLELEDGNYQLYRESAISGDYSGSLFSSGSESTRPRPPSRGK